MNQPPLNQWMYEHCTGAPCLKRSGGLGRVTLQEFDSDHGEYFLRRCEECDSLNKCAPMRVAKSLRDADFFGPIA